MTQTEFELERRIERLKTAVNDNATIIGAQQAEIIALKEEIAALKAGAAKDEALKNFRRAIENQDADIIRLREENARLLRPLAEQARTIDEQRQLVEVLRRIERLLGCQHVDNGPEDADNIVRHVRDLQEEIVRLKSLDDLNGRYIAQRDKQLREMTITTQSLARNLVLFRKLLKRVAHHGPQGSSSTPLCPPGCWKDCVACEYEKLSASSGAVASAASGTPNNSGETIRV